MIMRKRKILSNLALFVCFPTALWGIFWLFFIIIDVLRHGITAINPALFLNDPTPAVKLGGGLRNAFVGHFLITICATLIGVPVGVLGGTFLAEYGRKYKISKIISTLADIMVSVPAIIVVAFVYAVIVKPLGHFSGWAGAVAFAIIMIPTVLRTGIL
jgi:phosphate ABC transporter membrane protein 2, PhoT family (TC 3.A.1.7.1)